MKTGFYIPGLILLLMPGCNLLATPPQVTIQNQNPNGRYLVSTPVPFQVQATATAAGGAVYEVVMAVTNIADNSRATNFTLLASTASTNLNVYFRAPSVGTFQFTARARAGVNESAFETNWAVTSITVTNVGARERNFSHATYLSSHNSFLRDESFPRQIDSFNVWQLELDSSWKDGQVQVAHDCAWTFVPLTNYVAALASSVTKHERFTVVYLEFKPEASCTDAWPTQAIYRAAISNAFTSRLTRAAIYTPEDFRDIDSKAWPSFQELVRRGKNFAILLNEAGFLGAGGNNDNDFFFNETFDITNAARSAVLYSQNGGTSSDLNDVSVDESGLPDKERFLWRVYPNSQAGFETSARYWDFFVNRGFNFVASNRLDDEGKVTDASTQAPEPTFVAPASTESRQWGTFEYPYTLLAASVNRASPVTTIRLTVDEHLVWPGYVINKPVILKKAGGGPDGAVIKVPTAP